MSETPQHAYISKVHLKGYKSIKDLEVDFKPGLNIIIGPNGSGKTNFLECLKDIFLQELNTADTSATIEIQDKGTVKLKYATEKYTVKGKKSAIKTTFSLQINDLKEVKDSFVRGNDNRTIYFKRADDSQLDMDWDILDPRMHLIRFGIEEEFNQFLKNNFSLQLAYGEIEHTSQLRDGIYIVNFNLSEIFQNIINTYTSRSQFTKDFTNQIKIKAAFVEILKRYTPITEIAIDKDKIRLVTPPKYEEKKESDDIGLENIELMFKVEGTWLRWSQLSDGTKRLFYLFVSIFSTHETTIALEEPELGIHPDQLYLLMDFLKEQAKGKQIILTTHSPEVLNILDGNELDRIVVTRYDAENGTQMHHLSEKKIRKAIKYMSTEGLSIKDFWVHSNLEALDEAD